ncbi:hypothetical protein [Streptomyces venezuelae]|uniref:hypothetical protein n=1 Tax=Streptomyces venezuelae TaxID=54571 RepID=UPI00341F9696
MEIPDGGAAGEREPAVPEPVDVQGEAERLEAMLGLAGVEEVPSLAVPAAGTPFPAELARLVGDAGGRERLRLMLAEHPGLRRWLEGSVPGHDFLACLELGHGLEEPHPTAVEDAARTAGPRLAAFRRRWAAARRRDFDETQAYLASPAHTAASDQARAAMMDAFQQQRRA